MTRRHYSNTASAASAAVVVGASDTSIALADYAGFPSEPFIAVLDKDTSDEEIVLVTGVAGSTVTVIRGYDGTLAKAHAAGASFRHVAAAADFEEANEHVSATTGVHGISGAVVGTSDEQTLSNKTLTSPTITNPTFTGTASGVTASFSGTVSGSTGSFTTLTVSGNASVTGTLGVTGTTTLGALTAGASQLASATVTGNVGVGGTLSVTGAVSGTSGAFTGTVSAGTFSAPNATHDEIELEQQGTNPAGTASGHSSLWSSTDFGLYFRPSGQVARRLSAHWGSGSTLPTTGRIAGDTFYHTGLGSMLRWNGTNWRQIDGPVHIANMAARPSHADLHAGFQVWDISTDRLYIYDGTLWRTPDAMCFRGDLGGAGAGDYITCISQMETGVTNSSGIQGFGFDHTFSAAPVFVQATLGSQGSSLDVVSVVAEGGLHDATGINLRFFRKDGSLATGTTIRVSYTVIGYNN